MIRIFNPLVFLFTWLSTAQNGIVSGVVSDKDFNGSPLPYANVIVKGTSNGTTTDESGKYELQIAPGNYTLVYSFVGYEPREESVALVPNAQITLNIGLGSGGVALQDVVVTAVVNREKETALLLEQKNAIEIKTAIGAQELNRKGVGDVATAVTKTSGVTKQEGSGGIFVRGLGDRYNSTSMNGLPIASNDPEKKNIDLEIFPTGIVEYVSIDKVYNGRMYGDFSGGNIDIASKDYSGKGFVEFEIGSSINTNAVAEPFYLSERRDSFGFETANKPSTLVQYNFAGGFNLVSETPFGGSYALSAGNSWTVGEESRINLFATASFANAYSAYRDGIARTVNAEGVPTKDFYDFKHLEYTTRSTGMLNVGYKIKRSKLWYNFLFINSSSLENEEFSGLIQDIANEDNGFLRRGTFIRNTLLVNQILGKHTMSDRTKVNWGLSHNRVSNHIPDRVQNTLRLEPNGYILANNSESDNHRYFQELFEDEVAGLISADYKFHNKEDEYNARFIVGLNGKWKRRSLEATQFNFGISPSQAMTVVDPMNLNNFFNETNYNDGYFTISTFRGPAEIPTALKPQTYDGEQAILGGYANLEYTISRWIISGGLKSEFIHQSIKWQTQIDPLGDDDAFNKMAVLPHLTVKYSPHDKHNLRFAASKTYTLPQFKERAFFVYENVTVKKIGNPDLYPSDNYNVDFKWEFFPAKDELLSLGFFGKYIQNPINEITIASATDDISYVNIGAYGYVAGVEVEIRKSIFKSDKNKLSAGLNASYMDTSQELDDDKIRRETGNRINAVFNSTKESFTGASDLLINADITYAASVPNGHFLATIAWNHYSDRLFSIGTNGRGNLVDKAVSTFDIILRSDITQNLRMGIAGKNLLDPAIDRVQENRNGGVKVLSYRKGINLGINIEYNF